MRTRESRLGALVTLAAVLASGCASTMAPRGFLPSARSGGGEARGAWMVARVERDRTPVVVSGELIAIEADSVFVLTGSGLVGLPTAGIRTARVAGYESAWPELAAWTAVGTLSTISHGYGLILSAPLWVTTGTVATVAASHAPIRRYPRASWDDLRAWARFPQGLPPGLDRSLLRRR